jgi:acyl-CoA reductase-like NAD-dependent aldehyde dehydrogenase
MQPYLDALGIRIVFLPDDKDPAIVHPTAIMDPTSQGTVLYGVSKDGQVIITKHKDLEAQQRAAERLFDRVYGKPKQTNIIAGAAQNEDPHIVPFDDKRKAEVAAILEAAKKPSHQVTNNPTNPATNN